MRRTIQILAAAALLACVTTPAFAADEAKDKPKYGPVEEKAVLAGTAKLDSRAGYVLLQSTTRVFGILLRVPDDETRADYQADVDKAMAKARKRYAGQLAAWKAQASSAPEQKIAPPVEPTLESLNVPGLDLRDLASFGPSYVFNKAPDQFTYLTAVKPGTYIYYGPVIYAADGTAMGTCLCMGTVRFTVQPGLVTDIGNALFALPQPREPYDATTQETLERARRKAASGGKPPSESLPATPVAPAYGLPDSIKAWPSARGELTAQGKLNNYFGLMISRMFPIPGILDYRLDHIIDARTGTEIASDTIYTQVKIKK